MGLYLALAGVFAIGVFFRFDADRLAKHVLVAEALMSNGLSEDAAMEQSGCNFWDRPWYARLVFAYPPLPA